MHESLINLTFGHRDCATFRVFHCLGTRLGYLGDFPISLEEGLPCCLALWQLNDKDFTLELVVGPLPEPGLSCFVRTSN